MRFGHYQILAAPDLDRGRSTFLLKTARQEVRRRRLLRFLKGEHPAWKSEDHPELAAGTGTWVRKLRKQSDGRRAERKRRVTPKRK